MTRKLYAGIDGGGTKTKCIISYEDEKIIGQGKSGSTNPNYSGFNTTIDNINDSIVQALKDANIEQEDYIFESICMGLSGAGPINRKKLNYLFTDRNKYNKLPFKFKNLFIYGDSLIAWYGAFEGKPGIIVISGTGHFVYGRDTQTDKTSAGVQFEDLLRGGSFHLGLYGTQLALNALNKGDENDILLKLMLTFFNGKKLWPTKSKYSFKELLEDAQLCFKNKKMQILSREELASVARYVNAASVKRHHESRKLIEKTTSVIIRNIQYVKASLNFGRNEHVNVAIIGSLFKAFFLKHSIKPELAIVEPNIRLTSPENTPEKGALKIAINKIDFSNHS